MFKTKIAVNCIHQPPLIVCPVCGTEDGLWMKTPEKCWYCNTQFKIDMLGVVESKEIRRKYHFSDSSEVKNAKTGSTQYLPEDFQV